MKFSGTTIVVCHAMTSRVLRGMYMDVPQQEIVNLPKPHDGFFKLCNGNSFTCDAVDQDNACCESSMPNFFKQMQGVYSVASKASISRLRSANVSSATLWGISSTGLFR